MRLTQARPDAILLHVFGTLRVDGPGGARRLPGGRQRVLPEISSDVSEAHRAC